MHTHSLILTMFVKYSIQLCWLFFPLVFSNINTTIKTLCAALCMWLCVRLSAHRNLMFEKKILSLTIHTYTMCKMEDHTYSHTDTCNAEYILKDHQDVSFCILCDLILSRFITGKFRLSYGHPFTNIYFFWFHFMRLDENGFLLCLLICKQQAVVNFPIIYDKIPSTFQSMNICWRK